MRAVVVGGSGQIGGWLLRILKSAGHDAIGTRNQFDAPGLVFFDANSPPEAIEALLVPRPDVVFYPAGLTWVDLCEREPWLAESANRDQPLRFALAAKRVGARFVYFSTDYVFDGAAGPYDEAAAPNPLNAYGRSKLDAERALSDALGDSALIVRTCWVYGPERQGKNFAYQVVRTLRQGKPLVCPSDQISSPSYGPDVARAVVLLAESGQSGIVHVAGPEVVDRPRFARAVAEAFDLDPAPVVGRPTSELGQGAPRPLRTGLLTPGLDALHPGLMRPLSEALADFRARLASDERWASIISH
jgi:dTDP-4-dehydrorhamnose reductase